MENAHLEVFVGRQPIFDKNLNIFGYELLFRDSDISRARVEDGDVATSKVIVDGFTLAQKGTKKDTVFFINFPYNILTSNIAEVLPKKNVVVEILENVIVDRKVLKTCLELKKKGYVLALDDYVGEITNKNLFKIIDIVKIDILNMELDFIKKLILKIKKINPLVKILAEKVEDRDIFNSVKEFGAELFQGFFFQKPEVIKGKTIPPSTITRLNLLAFLSKKEHDLEDLEKMIRTDLTLSYKLLNYINSPAIGLPNKIKYIRQAINLLGYDNIINWCRIFLMSIINPTDIGIELIRQSVVRGYFFMGLKQVIKTDYTEDELFLLGLFSLLDALVGHSMDDVLKSMPLDKGIKDTLLGKDTPFLPYLEIIQYQERGNYSKIDKLSKQVGLSEDLIRSLYINALMETDKIFKGL